MADGEEPIQVALRIDDGMDETVTVTPLGDGRYRMEETPDFYRRATVGCIVGLRQHADGTWKIWKVFERPYRVRSLLIPNHFARSRALYDLGDWVQSLGGVWECVAHGMLTVHLPHDVEVDLPSEINRRIEAFVQAGGLSNPREIEWLATRDPRPPEKA